MTTSIADDLRGIKRNLGAAVAIVLIACGFIYANNNSQIASVNATRKEARIGVCAQDQQQASKAIQNAGEQARKFSDTVTANQPRTAALQKQIDDFVAGQEAVAADTYKQRDCTDDGIDAFYTNAPDPMPCPAGGDGKGYCK